MTFYPLSKESMTLIQQAQLEGKPVGPHLIKETALRHIVEKYNLFEEMFQPPAKAVSV